MSKIIDVVKELPELISTGAADSIEIESAENELDLKFASEYKEYLLAFGTASYYGHELTGICAKDSSINVVDVTLEERAFFTNVSKEWYVIEQIHIDGIVIWQDEKGCIYEATPQKIVLLYNSLKEYVEIA